MILHDGYIFFSNNYNGSVLALELKIFVLAEKGWEENILWKWYMPMW